MALSMDLLDEVTDQQERAKKRRAIAVRKIDQFVVDLERIKQSLERGETIWNIFTNSNAVGILAGLLSEVQTDDEYAKLLRLLLKEQAG